MNLFPDFKPFLGILRQERSELIAFLFCYFLEFDTRKECSYCSIFFVIFLNMRPEMSAIIARFRPIATNLSPEIVARKLVAVKVIPLQKSSPYDPLSFVRESNGKFCTFEGINWKAVEVYSTK